LGTADTEIQPALYSTFKKLTVERSLNTVVVNQTLALRMNICGENSQLLMAAIRGVT